jgi:hypothetical protein
MRATLIKKAEGWYNLYQDNIGIGSTHAELQGYKLSQENCEQAKEIEIEVEIEMEEYGYCEGCRRAGMWHCAHADTCGQNVTLKRPKLDENGCLILTKAEK